MCCIANSDSQFDGFVPVDNVTRQSERLKANNVHVAAFGANVQPLALKRQMTVANSEHTHRHISRNDVSLSSISSVIFQFLESLQGQFLQSISFSFKNNQ